MEVILLERVSSLGDLGVKVNVKPGFARNYLIPTGKALPATKNNLESFEARRAELEKAEQQRISGAQQRANALEGLSVSISAQAGEEGRLFGSVGAHEIVDAIKALGHELKKNEILLPNGAIRQIGEYDLVVSLLNNEVVANIHVSVVPAKG